jgi:hypothetical protein
MREAVASYLAYEVEKDRATCCALADVDADRGRSVPKPSKHGRTVSTRLTRYRCRNPSDEMWWMDYEIRYEVTADALYITDVFHTRQDRETFH